MSAKDFKLQQQVEILEKKSKIKATTFKGKIISITKHFITVQNEGGIRESFKFIDFSIGAIQLKNSNLCVSK